MENKKLGGNIDSWCGKCKLVLAHTIEAMVGEKPTRVLCNTCKSHHTYKAQAPRTSTGTTTRTPKPKTSRYQSLLNASDPAAAKTYSPNTRYEHGDILEHHTLGRGVTTALKEGAKIEVLFESGLKTLVHARTSFGMS
jgi:hypothetical protein